MGKTPMMAIWSCACWRAWPCSIRPVSSVGHVTMEEIVFSLQHHWRFLNAKNLEFHGLSCGSDLEAA